MYVLRNAISNLYELLSEWWYETWRAVRWVWIEPRERKARAARRQEIIAQWAAMPTAVVKRDDYNDLMQNPHFNTTDGYPFGVKPLRHEIGCLPVKNGDTHRLTRIIMEGY